jgi:hypothetical protein
MFRINMLSALLYTEKHVAKVVLIEYDLGCSEQ